ncbi:Carboxylic ester hydrolase [Pleurotus pulmonarius]
MRATLPLLALLSLAVAQAPAPVIDVGNAKYQGTVNAKNNISTYFGIRYAAAPVGDLRFRAPQSPPALVGVQRATTKPPRCLQASSGRSPTNPNPKSSLSGRAVQDHEDCLFLNVHFPGSTIPTRLLPVIVWIHGGRYIAGGASGFNGGDLIIRAKNGVVVVVIQYRLGIFGFLAGSKVKANGALNAGLLDQEFALKWVQQHISKFGGDPNQVTIWGESAGAGSVLQHVVARNGSTSPPLFRAAISSSSFLPSQHPFDGAVPERIFSQVVSQIGCGGAADALSCLRAAGVAKLQAANLRINHAGFYGTLVTVPVVDGDFITQRPSMALRQRRVNGEALLAVTNTHEGNGFVNQSTAATVKAANYALRLFPDLGAANAATVARLYAPVGSPISQVNAIMGESIFVCPTYSMLNAFPAASFKGEFAVPNGYHGVDQAFYFPSGRTPAFKNTAFIISFAGAFVDFATSLDPNEKIDSGNITPSRRARIHILTQGYMKVTKK